MKLFRALLLAGTSLFLTACGEDGPIDIVKEATLPEYCADATIGDMLVLYFPTTTWTGHYDADRGGYMIFGEGEVLYYGITRVAKVGFFLEDGTNAVSYENLSFNGQMQVGSTARDLFRVMCEEATS